jgi:hypothetical protein
MRTPGILVSLLILSFFFSCQKSSGSDSDSLALLALLGAQNRTVTEPRPFRTRTVALSQSGSTLVYDWNFDRVIPAYSGPDAEDLMGDPVSGGTELFPSETGRYSYVKTGSGFRILDSELNLSPHGDHFHSERSFYHRTVHPNRLPGLNAGIGESPYRVDSQDGWAGFFFTHPSGDSRIEFVREKDLGGMDPHESLVSISGPDPLPEGLQGWGILIRATGDHYYALVTDGLGSGSKPNQIGFYEADNSSVTWSDKNFVSGSGSKISCSKYQGHSIQQIPTKDADFTDLENGYTKIRYIAILCGGNQVRVVRWNDSTNSATTYTISVPGLGSGEILRNIRPLTQNQNIERGGRTNRPIFLANTGGAETDRVFRIDAESRSSIPIPTPVYRSRFFGSETQLGDVVYVLGTDGVIYGLDSLSGRRVSRVRIGIPLDSVQDFVTTWRAGFIVSENSLHEFNLEENYKARVWQPFSQNLRSVSIHGFFGKGSDYTGDED